MARIRLLFILNGVAIAAFGPFASVILADRGFETAQIGLLSALVSVAFVLSISVWGHLGDVVLGRARRCGRGAGRGRAARAVHAAACRSRRSACCTSPMRPQRAVGRCPTRWPSTPCATLAASTARYGRWASASLAVAAVIVGFLYGRPATGRRRPVWASRSPIAVNAGGAPGPRPREADRQPPRRRGARGAGDPAGARRGSCRASGLAHVGVFAGSRSSRSGSSSWAAGRRRSRCRRRWRPRPRSAP